MVRFIFYGFVIYLLYKFIVELVIPVGKATSRVKEQIRRVKEQQEAQQSFYRQKEAETPSGQPAAKNNTDKDYIDFEEIK